MTHMVTSAHVGVFRRVSVRLSSGHVDLIKLQTFPREQEKSDFFFGGGAKQRMKS